MPVFVQLVSCSSQRGNFDEMKDTGRINAFLTRLQDEGARIISVTPALGGKMEIISAVYVITYEAPEAILVE